MSTTFQTPPAPPSYTIKRHHMHWGVLIAFLIILILATFGTLAYLYRGQTIVVDGKPLLTVPNIGTVQLVTPDGRTAEAVVQTPPPPAPNGKTPTTIVDGFGAEQRLQRVETNVDRYDPIDRLANNLATTTKATRDDISALADAVRVTNVSIKSTNDAVGKVAGSVSDLSKQVAGLGGQLTAIEGRVSELEKKPAPAASAPAPLPAAPAASSSAPAPAPQAAVAPAPAPAARVAQAGEKEVVVPKGWHIDAVVDQSDGERCFAKGPGFKLVLTEKMGKARDGHMIHLFACVPPSDPRPSAS